MRLEKMSADNGIAPPTTAVSQEAENRALKEKLATAYTTILAQEKRLANAAEQQAELKHKINQLEARLKEALSAPPRLDPALAALETRLMTMEKEVAWLLSQPNPPAAPQPVDAPPKPVRKTPNEVLLDRLDKRLRNGQE